MAPRHWTDVLVEHRLATMEDRLRQQFDELLAIRGEIYREIRAVRAELREEIAIYRREKR